MIKLRAKAEADENGNDVRDGATTGLEHDKTASQGRGGREREDIRDGAIQDLSMIKETYWREGILLEGEIDTLMRYAA